jgi:hypothetical protein
MGATTFEDYAWGRTPQEAYNAAVAEAIFNHGHEPYSGTIKEKDGFIMIEVPKAFKNKPEEYAYKLMNDDDRRIEDKWGPAGCILLESQDAIEKVPYATTVERYDQQGARKWETVFTVYSRAGGASRSFTSQTEAEKFAKDWVKANNEVAKIRIEKRLVNGSQEIITIKPKTKDVKVKGGKNKYMFFGWASC